MLRDFRRSSRGAREGRATGVVHEHVEAAEPADRRRDELPDRVLAVEVAGDHEHVAPGGVADLLRGLVEIAARPAADRDLHALLGQHLRARAPETLARAADDRNLARELEIHE